MTYCNVVSGLFLLKCAKIKNIYIYKLFCFPLMYAGNRERHKTAGKVLLMSYCAAFVCEYAQHPFFFFQNSVQAGLSIQLSGIAWWTTDIGGYSGGNPKDPLFNELIVRWFQFGATCPLFRQHGARSTEPWLLSNESYNLVVATIKMRNSLRQYVLSQMQAVNETGLPVNRPLWFEFPCDDSVWAITDQYMFGNDFMAAPVYTYQARNRSVYFPKASSWQHFFTNKTYTGGQTVTVDAPLENFPLFRRMQFNSVCQ